MLEEIRKGDHPILDYATETSLKQMFDAYRKSDKRVILFQDDGDGFLFAGIAPIPFNLNHNVALETYTYSKNGRLHELLEKLEKWAYDNDAVAIQISHVNHTGLNEVYKRLYQQKFSPLSGYIYTKRI